MKIHFFTILLLLAFIFIIANTSYSHELIVRQDNNQNYQSQDTSPQYVALNFTAAGNLNPIVSYNLPTYLELYSRITYSDSLSNGITGVKSKNKSTYIHHDDEAKTYESISNLTLRHQYISMYSKISNLFKILEIKNKISNQQTEYDHLIYKQSINGKFSNTPDEQIYIKNSSLLTGTFAKFKDLVFFQKVSTKTTSYGLYNSQNFTSFDFYKFDQKNNNFEKVPSISIKKNGIPCPGLNLRDIDGDGNADLVLLRALSNSITPSQLIADGLNNNIVFYLDFYFYNKQEKKYDDIPNIQYKFKAGISNLPTFSLQFIEDKCTPILIKAAGNEIQKFYYNNTTNKFTNF